MATAVGFTTDLSSDLATSGGLQQGAWDWVWEEDGAARGVGVPASDRAGVWGGAPCKKREGRSRHRVEPPIGRSRGDYFDTGRRPVSFV